LSVNDIKGCRKIALKGLYGDQELLKQFIANFRQRTINLVNSQTKVPDKVSYRGGRKNVMP
jgi:hypothetical protein